MLARFANARSLPITSRRRLPRAQVAAPSRYWLLSADRLVKLRQSSPEIVNAIELGIAQDLRRKVESANKRSRLRA